VGVDHGGVELRVPEELGDTFKLDTLFVEGGGEGVPEIGRASCRERV